jgi:hypothetical protein
MSNASQPSRFPGRVLAALAAVAALGFGSIALIAIATRPAGGVAPVPAVAAPALALEAPPPAAPEPEPTGPAPEAPQQLAFAPSPDGKGPPVPLPPSGIVYNPNPAAGRAGAPGTAASPALTRLMPSRARSLITAAIEMQVPSMAACFRKDGGSPIRRTAMNRRALWSGMGGRGVLRLTLEPRAGELLIHDAAVEQRGSASGAELACAQRALRGMALDLPDAAPGAQVSMLYPIP